MVLRIGINGFGRIGRLVLRQALQHSDVQVVVINDLIEADHLAYLFQYDTVHGRFPGRVEVSQDGAGQNTLHVGEKSINLTAISALENLDWKRYGVDYVIESTGLFKDPDTCQKHRKAGAKRVIVSAPAKGDVPTFVMGVNEDRYEPNKHFIVSNASCTTNCLAPVAKVLVDHFGIEEGLMTTVHAVTSSQPSVDGPSKKDWRGGRSSFQNIIPATTGAAQAVALCIPELKGKLTGMALRVPTIDVSVVDLTVRLKKDTTYPEICSVMKEVSQTTMKGILAYQEALCVSSDFVGDTHSSIFDSKAGIALNSRFYKLISWYDNEMGYAARLVDLARYMASKETALPLR
jgi:glyceraldehyde 3-phosphate dehydrogenase